MTTAEYNTEAQHRGQRHSPLYIIRAVGQYDHLGSCRLYGTACRWCVELHPHFVCTVICVSFMLLELLCQHCQRMANCWHGS